MTHNDAFSVAHPLLLNFYKIVVSHWCIRNIHVKRKRTIAVKLYLFWSQILSKLFRKSLKFLTKRDTPALFKCNLLL